MDDRSEEKARLEALRAVARVGIADIAADRFRTFESRSPLKRHLVSLAEEAIGGKPSRPQPK